MSIINTSAPSNEILIKLGARGNLSPGVDKWDEVYNGRLRQILISHGVAINSIQVSYTAPSGALVLAPRHGGDGDKFDCVDLESWEALTMVQGYYGPLRGNNAGVVRSLTFGTNGATYGPFGIEEGIPFRFNIPPGVGFGGFHGCSDSRYLHAIGIYIKSMARYHLAPKPERVSFSRSTYSVEY
ncbi:inactive protein RESTRICTED TEV MOVEMENT 1-like [Phoenix dactylifera]|uniref:Inactive protein RESTRICTED TEV MOVEMENT 1-like n=1 Tax=Phoenix dactylifera TaxID=42345 RepID=A0A8B8ZQ19_PHODC|nr:inactive protein RESTRICTED TEV MOVEMENT 1-like [Phoenix dactylifera]XP_038987243.1 inactive protein RESTRICTED TEV MOVEMENT 1-like [Phoenix dactylifera]